MIESTLNPCTRVKFVTNFSTVIFHYIKFESINLDSIFRERYDAIYQSV